MSTINPYNCTKSGNLFVGYDRLLEQLLNGFRDGHSFALIGGRRCGKTSLLLQVQKELQEASFKPLRLMPKYLDIQGLDKVSCEILFETVYSLTVGNIEAEPWQFGVSEKIYENFLRYMDKAKPLLDEKYGSDWVVVLLVDELDAAINSLPDDQFFQNLRNLLMSSRFHRHFRMVASGVNNLSKLISSGSSPLNNLRVKYLSILTVKQARQLLSSGFPEDFDDDLEQMLFRITGRHPYLLQGLLEKLWTSRNNLNKNYLKSCVREFLLEHNDFHRWLDAFGPSEHAVYQILSKALDGYIHIRDIRADLESALKPQLDDALITLSYHGVIDDSDPDEPQISGTMFRDWYKNNAPVFRDADKVDQSHAGKTASTTFTPSINIQVNPVIESHGGSIHSGMSAEDVLKIFKELKTQITSLDIEERAKKQALNAMVEGEIELEHPKPGKEPDKSSIKAALEKSTSILRSAGASVGSLENFIKKAESIAPYIGQAADWLGIIMSGNMP